MRGSKFKVRALCAVFLGVIAAPALAALLLVPWDHPCEDDPAATLSCVSGQCTCEGDWDTVANWSGAWSYPDGTSEEARIDHSNVGYCEGGSEEGSPCSRDGDCLGGTCDNIETRLQVNLTTETVGELRLLTTAYENTATDKLTVEFQSKGTGGKTVTAGFVWLDATNGAITFSITDSAALKTDNTD